MYRQDAGGESRVVALRGVRGDGEFALRDAETDQPLGTFSAAQLRAGMEVSLPQRSSARVLLIDPF